MIPYKWEENEKAYLALMRPIDFFIEGTISESERHEYEFTLTGTLKEGGETGIFAFGYDKEVFDRKTAERYNSWIDDHYSWNPIEEIRTKEVIIPEQERKAA